MEYTIEKTSLRHEEAIKKFDCGNLVLNDYLYNKALNDFDAVTYIVIDNENSCIISYFSISCSAIYHKIAQNRFIHYPAVELKNFATDINYQHRVYMDGITYSRSILEYIKYFLIKDFTDNICGASRIILYSTPEAVNFYKNAGFEDFYKEFLSDSSAYLEGCTPLLFLYD